MFDLEQAITDWRKQMLATGIQTPVPLEELEIHLREEIARQLKSGRDAQQSLDIALKHLGQPADLKKEFKKTDEPFNVPLVELASIGCFAAALLFALWILFVIFSVRETDWLAKLAGVAGIAMAGVAWTYNHKLLPVIRKRFIRSVIGFLCCLGCVVWIQLFIRDYAPHLVQPSGSEPPIRIHSQEGALFGPRFTGVNAPPVLETPVHRTNRFNSEQTNDLTIAAFLWGWTVMAIFGGVGFGLERAVRKSATA